MWTGQKCVSAVLNIFLTNTKSPCLDNPPECPFGLLLGHLARVGCLLIHPTLLVHHFFSIGNKSDSGKTEKLMISLVPASVEILRQLFNLSLSYRRGLQRPEDVVLDLTGQQHFLHCYLLSLD